MIGYLQIVVCLICVAIFYKGVEIFQAAYTSTNQDSRPSAMLLGVVMIVGAVGVGIAAIAVMSLLQGELDRIPGR